MLLGPSQQKGGMAFVLGSTSSDNTTRDLLLSAYDGTSGQSAWQIRKAGASASAIAADGKQVFIGGEEQKQSFKGQSCLVVSLLVILYHGPVGFYSGADAVRAILTEACPTITQFLDVNRERFSLSGSSVWIGANY